MVTNGYLYYQAYNYVQDYLIYYGIIVLDLIVLLVLLMLSLSILIANAAKNMKINPIYINIVFVALFL